jgi:RHS repeat-associated protein
MFRKVLWILTVLFIFALALTVTAGPAGAEELTVFQKDFAVGKLHLHLSQHRFQIEEPSAGRLEITKAASGIQGGFVLFNDALILLPHFFTGDEPVFKKPVGLKSVNHLLVFLVGSPGASITLRVIAEAGLPAGPEITVFAADPALIQRGESSLLSWLTENADFCEIEPDIGRVEAGGSYSVSPAAATTYTLTATGSGGTVTAAVTVTLVNSAPVAAAGADQSVFVGDIVGLNGGNCYDVDGDPLTYKWSFASIPAGSTAVISAAGLAAAGFVPDVAGTYVVELVVNDGTADSEADTAIITAQPRMVAVPDVVGLPQAAGEAALQAAHLKVGAVSFEHSETAAEGHVIGQSPVAGTSVAENSPVDLILSLGPESQVPAVSLIASPSSIAQGCFAVLSWTSLWAQSAHIDNGIGNVSVEGSLEVSPEHTSCYTITVTGPAGSANAQATVEVTGRPIEQPEGSYGKQYEDLVPPDATVDQYDPDRFSLITGLVYDIDQMPMAGVAVSVHRHAEYGSAASDEQGRFSIPVEGGGTLTIIYQKQGLIPVQRKVYVPWNDNAIAETVVMITEDPVATTVSFDGHADTVVTHTSKDVVDDAGTRAVTMVFSGDNQAYLTDEQGNDAQALTTITTRATEYRRPESMPAELPPNSAFTFCAELSVDGVQRVRFDKPVTTFIDNFLGFPVGSIVPVGYYDRDKGVWVPSENGVVVELLDSDGDGAVDALDADGDGQPDDLDADGSFVGEVKGLDDSRRYAAGTTFWRVEVKHFSPYDYNWPFGPPPDAVAPNAKGSVVVDQQDSSSYGAGGKALNDIQCLASFVEQRSRVFHEDIAIPGTDMTLHYTGSRAAGYKPGVMTVPASGDTVPASLCKILVKVNVAGKSYQVELPPEPNQIAEIEWDGLDYLGRPVKGSAVAHVRIGLVYYGVYYSPGTGGRAFGQAGLNPLTIPSRKEVTLWSDSDLPIVRGRGTIADGWTLSLHHQAGPLDPSTIIKGDGTIDKSNVSIVDTYAGNGTGGYSDDGGPATEAALALIGSGITCDAAGNLYFSENAYYWIPTGDRIRKVDKNGIITSPVVGLDNPLGIAIDGQENIYVAEHSRACITKVDPEGRKTVFAGIRGQTGYSGDNGPATEAKINYPIDLELDDQGNLYFADTYNHCIRKVDAGGIITTVAGTGARGSSPDGVRATEAQFTYPSHIAVDAAGNLYIEDGYRVRKVDTSGMLSTVAGNGDSQVSGDGGPAIEAGLGEVYGIEIDAAGNLYIGSWYTHRVRKVDTGGIITTVAGTGPTGVNEGGFGGDGGPATLARLNIAWDLALDPAGNLFILDYGNERIRIVRPPALGLQKAGSASDLVFTEENGLGHIMSAAGLHKKTIDTATGVVLHTFDYDPDGNLISIRDRFGNIVAIERDAAGSATAIVSADGIRTELTIGDDNHLTRVAYEDGSFYDFTYTPDGLMTAEIEPSGNRFEHVFDEQGRLKEVVDEQGGHWSYTRTVDSNSNVLMEVLSGEGNLTSFLDHTDSTGKYTSVITDSAGAVSRFVQSDDGLTVNQSLACGTELEYVYDLDPEYKYQYIKQLTQSTPAGLQKQTTVNRIYANTDPYGIPELITATVTVNGKAVTVQNDILAAQKTVTTPMGKTVTSFYDPATLRVKSVSVSGLHPTTYGYDSRGRLTLIGTNTRQSSFVYNAQGFLGSVTDSKGRTTAYDYDPVGRVTGISRPDGGYVGFGYDKNGNLTVLTNPVDIRHRFGYNRVNQTSSYTTPLSGSYSYGYDRDRRLIRTEFPSGKQIVNVYDKSQLIRVETPEGDIDLTYLCGSKPESVSNGLEAISYGYDGSLVVSETFSGTLNQSLLYTYNNDFDVSGFSYAEHSTGYSYDDDGLLTAAGNFIISRNAQNGLPESVGDGTLSVDRSFNGYGELSGQSAAVAGQAPASWTLTRDDNGRITGKTEAAGGAFADYNYSYDSMGRLLTVIKDGVRVEEYRYDLAGTRIYEMNSLRGISGRNFAYSDEDHLLTAGDATYQYDRDGFLTTRARAAATTRYFYSLRGELLRVDLPDDRIIEYLHDPLGRRIAKKVNGSIVEKYLWQGLTRLLVVYDGSDNLIMRFDYADDRVPFAVEIGGVTYYLAYDQIGSLKVVADGSGNVVKRIEYDSFGNVVEDTNPLFAVPIGFAGGLYDVDTSLVRFGFRDYDSDVGRWTSKDPVGFAGGDTDLYGYVLNDPVNWVDPQGVFGIGLKEGGDFWGHSDFTGSDQFDFNKEDRGLTSPMIQPWRHFRDLKDIEEDINKAILNRDRDAFERYMHQGQDYFVHYLKGYRWYPQWDYGLGHLPYLNADENYEAWLKAEEWTKTWLNIWDTPCP